MIGSNDIINAKKCGDIFSQDVTQTKELYKKLAKMYHPDLCKLENANEIFAKISTLYNSALDNLEKGSWEVSSMVELKSSSGKCYTLRYLSRFDFELGECYIGNKKVVYILNEDKKKYFYRYLGIVSRLEYKNKEMRDEFERYLPNVLTSFDMKDGKYCIILNNTFDVYTKDVRYNLVFTHLQDTNGAIKDVDGDFLLNKQSLNSLEISQLLYELYA